VIGKTVRFCVKEIIGGMINIRKEENIEELWEFTSVQNSFFILKGESQSGRLVIAS